MDEALMLCERELETVKLCEREVLLAAKRRLNYALFKLDQAWASCKGAARRLQTAAHAASEAGTMCHGLARRLEERAVTVAEAQSAPQKEGEDRR